MVEVFPTDKCGMPSSNTFALDIRDPKDYCSRKNKSQAYRKEWNDSSVMSLQTVNFLLSLSFLVYTDFLKKNINPTIKNYVN